MFIERNVFHLKFGLGKPATDLWRAFLHTVPAQSDFRIRLLSDLSGPAYVLVLELAYGTYAELEPSRCRLTQLPGWRAFYEQFIPMCERSERTLYREVEGITLAAPPH